MRHLLLFFIGLLLFPLGLSAQNASSDEPSSLLPDINPQDIEIRGDFRARFPGITRQPILGFNPTPRVFRLDPNRMPFLESPEEIVASVPLAQLEAELGPERILQQHPKQSRIFGYTGYGMFNSPEAEVYASLPVNERIAVFSNIFMQASEGHLEDPTFRNAAYRRLNGQVTVRNQRSFNSNLFIHLNGRSDFSNTVTNRILQSRLNLHNFGGGASWVKHTSAFDFFSLYGGVGHTIAQKSFDQNPTINPGFFTYPDASETKFTLGGTRSWAGSRIGQVFRIETDNQFAIYDTEGQLTNWGVASVSGFWRRDYNSGARFDVGAKMFGGYDEIYEGSFRVYPYLAYRFTTTSGLRIGAEFSGEIKNHGLENAHIVNRQSIGGGPMVNEERIYTNVNVELDLGNVATIHGHFHGSYTSRPRMFTAIDGRWVHPKELFLLQPGGGISMNVMPQILTVYANGTLNIYNLNDSFYSKFQNLERFRLTSGARSTLAENISIHAWLDVIGPRQLENPSSFQNELPELKTILLLNAQAEYRINGVIGVYVKAMNLLGQEYTFWPYFEERPFQVFGGITFKL